jgi:bacteriocin biosynthesis cyclodehydratase domain-containing protein
MQLTHIADKFIPEIKEIYQVVPAVGGAVHIRSGDEIILEVGGKKAHLLSRLLLAIDGKKDLSQIEVELADSYTGAEISRAIMFLQTEGILQDRKDSPPLPTDQLRRQARYLAHYLQEADETVQNLAAVSCLVVGKGGLAGAISHLLVQHGLEKVVSITQELTANDLHDNELDELEKKLVTSDVAVCTTQTFAPHLCRVVNDLAIEHQKPILYVDMSSGNHGIIGPLCIPGQSSCYTCYEQRLAINTDVHEERLDYEFFLTNRPHKRSSYGTLIAFEHIVCGLAVVELLSYLTAYRAPRTIDGTLIIDFFQPEIYREPVLKLPNCKSCSEIHSFNAK